MQQQQHPSDGSGTKEHQKINPNNILPPEQAPDLLEDTALPVSDVLEAFNKAFTWQQEQEQQVEPDAAAEQQDVQEGSGPSWPAAAHPAPHTAVAAADLDLLQQQQDCGQPSGAHQCHEQQAPALSSSKAAPLEQQQAGRTVQQPAQGVGLQGSHTGSSANQPLHAKQEPCMPGTLRQGPVAGSVGGEEKQQQCQAVMEVSGADGCHVHSAADGPAQGVGQAPCVWCGAVGPKSGSSTVKPQPC